MASEKKWKPVNQPTQKKDYSAENPLEGNQAPGAGNPSADSNSDNSIEKTAPKIQATSGQAPTEPTAPATTAQPQLTPEQQKAAEAETLKKEQDKRFKIADKFSKKLIEKFKRSVKAVVVYGSTAKGTATEKSDIDIFVVMDDTKIEEEVPREVKDRIWNDILQVAKETDPNITIQAFMFLTEFWENLRIAEPVLIAILRYGVIVFDVGVFEPAQRMLFRGKIPTTYEAVTKKMKAAPEFIDFGKSRLQSVGHYLEQAVATAGNGALMLIGRMPQNKEDVAHALKESFVEQGILEGKYAQMIDEIRAFSKRTEHMKPEDTKGLGFECDKYIEMADEVVKRLEKLVHDLDDRKKGTVLMKTYKTFLKANVGALRFVGIEPPQQLQELPKIFQEHFPEVKEIQEYLFDELAKQLTLVRDGKGDAIPDEIVYKMREKTKVFVTELGKVLKKLESEGKVKPQQGQTADPLKGLEQEFSDLGAGDIGDSQK